MEGLAVKPLALIALLLMVGCASPKMTGNDYPPRIASQCERARAESIRRYPGLPVLPVKVVEVDNPRAGMGAWTVGHRGGYLVTIWVGQRPWYGSLKHEMDHCFPGHSSEESIR